MVRNNKKNNQSIKRKLITMTNAKSPISEQYKTIRTNIQFSIVDHETRSIMVTSSSPGEGKSTTVANMAVVFAQLGKKVLLIDADLRKPTVHYTFQLNNHIGLTNVLTKQATIEEASKETNQENLFVLPSGPIPPNPAELLGSRAMADLIVNAYKEFDMIIFDTPPVIAVTDAQVLANQCDGVVLVVSSGKTENEMAVRSKELLTNAKAKMLGVVLNNKRQKDSQYYYYYGQN